MAKNNNPSLSVFAPMTGSVIELSEVPDERMASRKIGDGVAIVPEDDGGLYSPISGTVVQIPDEENSTFLFKTDDGLEIMVCVGMGEKLPLSAFDLNVKQEAAVQAGDLVAEIDLQALRNAGIDPTTLVLVPGGFEGVVIEPGPDKQVLAGAGAVFTLQDIKIPEPEEPKDEPETQEEAKEPAAKEEKPAKKPKKAAPAAGNPIAEIKEYLAQPGVMLKVGIALLVITVLMVAFFVSLAIFLAPEEAAGV